MNSLLEAFKALKEAEIEEIEEQPEEDVTVETDVPTEKDDEASVDETPSEVTEDDLNLYREALTSWKADWDEEHDEPFPEFTEEELERFVEMILTLQDLPVEDEQSIEDEQPEEGSGEEGEELEEDFASTFPVQYLPKQESRTFIENIPTPDPHRPPYFFKLGYAKELDKEIAAKFRGGRGSEGNPFVRIVKCTEYSKLYTGSDWRRTDDTKHADKVLGTARHTGEKTGFRFGDEGVVNKIGIYGNGEEALQAYIADSSVQKVKFFVSLDGGDLQEASREEVAQYLTTRFADKILNPDAVVRSIAGYDAEGNEIKDKPINRFYLSRIYMIGNLGRSIF